MFMKKIILFILVLIVSSLLWAHEYILLAYKYRVQKGDTLEMHLFSSDGFNIQFERPMQKAITKKFELITQDRTTDLLSSSKDGALPVVNMKVDFEGLGLLYMERDYARITLPTNEFLSYIKEDHIENISAKLDTTKKFQRERYTRYIKSLVNSGNVNTDTLFKKITGQNLEILLLQNPYLLHQKDILKVQILFMGSPLTNKIITARNRTGSENLIALTSRTDTHGICSFMMVRKGEWFIHTTQMIPCHDKNDSDWESFWASYSFEID